MNELHGKIIYLREIEETDVNHKYCNWLNDAEINQYTETRFAPQTIESILDFIKKQKTSIKTFFAICLTENDEHIGNIKLGPINNHHKSADIGLIIGEKKCWGRGCATEAIKIITEYAFNTLNLNKLQAGAYSENYGSINAFKKAGYMQEGLLKKQVLINNDLMDVVLLGITSDDFKGGH